MSVYQKKEFFYFFKLTGFPQGNKVSPYHGLQIASLGRLVSPIRNKKPVRLGAAIFVIKVLKCHSAHPMGMVRNRTSIGRERVAAMLEKGN